MLPGNLYPWETYHGHVKTTTDAIKLFEATRQGILPRVQRRLSEKERQQIRSGSVFVWDEREAGMRRWTDGKSWSASRVSGSFLTYREMEGKRGGGFGSGARRTGGKTPDSGRGSDEEQDDREPNGYSYKVDGLTKQSFSITTAQGQKLHLISYLAQRGGHELKVPTQDPDLKDVRIPRGLYPDSNPSEPSGTAASTRTPVHQPAYASPAPPPPAPPHPSYPTQAPYHPGPYYQHPAPHSQHPAPHSQPPSSYSQPSSAWLPSPGATPPNSSAQYHQPPQQYSPHHYPPSHYPPHTLPPPQHHYSHGPPPPPPPHTYSYGPAHHHERLPPPQPAPPSHHRPGMTLPHPQGYPTQNHPRSPHQHYQHSPPHTTPHPQPQPHQSQHQPPQPPPTTLMEEREPIRSAHSPHSIPQRSPKMDHVQLAAAAAAIVDRNPEIAAQARRSPQHTQQQWQNGASTLSPSLTRESISPPGSRSPDGKDATGPAAGNYKVSLSAILHPTSSESNGTNSTVNGGNTSPKAPSGGLANDLSPRNGRESMEARAIGALDKGFCKKD
ncbi:Gti1/Pac2 family domain containing protein [Naviculisporaceae sp. PSN 640]